MLELGGEKEIVRVTADENGKYRIALPPGDYVLEIATTAVAATSAQRRNRSQ